MSEVRRRDTLAFPTVYCSIDCLVCLIFSLEKEKERKRDGEKREREERREGKTEWGTRDRRLIRQG
jgi:hypothetical protein